MKRILFLLFIAFAFIGCQNEDETIITEDELTGSCWFQDIDYYQTYTFWFGKNGKCTVQWKTGIGNPITFEGKYDFKKPNITIYSPSKNEYASGYIQGDTIYLNHLDDILKLTKAW